MVNVSHCRIVVIAFITFIMPGIWFNTDVIIFSGSLALDPLADKSLYTSYIKHTRTSKTSCDLSCVKEDWGRRSGGLYYFIVELHYLPSR